MDNCPFCHETYCKNCEVKDHQLNEPLNNFLGMLNGGSDAPAAGAGSGGAAGIQKLISEDVFENVPEWMNLK